MTYKDNENPMKKYVVLEGILNSINSRVISLQSSEIKRNNILLGVVTEKIIGNMKQKDQLFGGLYKEKFHGGSYYDNLKVGNPNEYDLDLILNLPVSSEPIVKCSDQPGFVHVDVKGYYKILERPEAERTRYEKINVLLDQGNYLSTDRVLKWFEGVITKALKAMEDNENGTYVDAVLDRSKPNEVIRIYVKMAKGYPAFTLRLSGKDLDDSDIQLDIDLVPCFSFFNANWPDKSGGYRSNPSKKDRFLVVPKKPKEESISKSPTIDRYWRLSFQEQEREMISGAELKVLKPSLKLLKKLRDKHNHKIASYFIKTIYLWTVTKEPASFWCQPLSVVFMSMLKIYEEHIRSKKIPYYWNDKYDLIGYLKDSTKSDIANTLSNIISDVDKNLDDPLGDPYVIGKYLLPKEEFEKLKAEVKLSNKRIKQSQFASTSHILNSPSVDIPDSALSDIPPLLRLGFQPQLIDSHRQYSDTVEEYQRRSFDEIMSQISNGKSTNDNEIVRYLKNIDEKMDKMLERFDKSLEDRNKSIARLSALEEKVKLLEIENRNLKSRLTQDNSMEVNSIDHLLGIRQIETSGDNNFLH